jgi:hypothetical protein
MMNVKAASKKAVAIPALNTRNDFMIFKMIEENSNS